MEKAVDGYIDGREEGFEVEVFNGDIAPGRGVVNDDVDAAVGLYPEVNDIAYGLSISDIGESCDRLSAHGLNLFDDFITEVLSRLSVDYQPGACPSEF